MSRLYRMIALDPCVADVRRLRDCMARLEGVRVSLQHLTDPASAIMRLPLMEADLLFVDEDLDCVTGVEAIRALRGAGERRPIVASSSVDCGYLAADLVRAGADAYLSKADLSPAMVRRLIDRAMQQARHRNAGEKLQREALRLIHAGH